MSQYGDAMINASRDLNAAKRELRGVYATPSAPGYAKRATAARKKIKAAEATYKDVKAKFDAEVAESRRQIDRDIKRLDEVLGKSRKGGRPAKKGTRRTRRRV